MENSPLINEAEIFIARVVNGTYDNAICERLKKIFGVDDVVFEGGKPQTYMYLIKDNNVYELLVFHHSPIPKVYYNYEIFDQFGGIIQKERATIENLVKLRVKIKKLKQVLLNK